MATTIQPRLERKAARCFQELTKFAKDYHDKDSSTTREDIFKAFHNMAETFFTIHSNLYDPVDMGQPGGPPGDDDVYDAFLEVTTLLRTHFKIKL